MDKVYVVYIHQDGYGGGGYPVKVFNDEHDAKQFVETTKYEFVKGHTTTDHTYDEFIVE
jgi:hypothetical protein